MTKSESDAALSESRLQPAEAHLAPLLQSIGRAVLGAAALEKVLLVDIASRRAGDSGLTEALGLDLARLERQPAGPLLKNLRSLGLSPELADRVADVIDKRNWLVHRFMTSADAVAAITGAGVDEMVERIDRIAYECQQVIDELAPAAFSGVEAALGLPFAELLEVVLRIDPATVTDPATRAQIEMIQNSDTSELLGLNGGAQDSA